MLVMLDVLDVLDVLFMLDVLVVLDVLFMLVVLVVVESIALDTSVLLLLLPLFINALAFELKANTPKPKNTIIHEYLVLISFLSPYKKG